MASISREASRQYAPAARCQLYHPPSITFSLLHLAITKALMNLGIFADISKSKP